MKFRMKLFSLLAILISLGVTTASSAYSAMTEWQDLGGGKARLIAILDPSSNEVTGVVEVDLMDGWKTYWRSPGQTGIPPEFDFSKSRGIEIGDVRFPPPELIKIPSSSFVGYHNSVRFVFSGQASGPSPMVQMSLLIGVCEEICIPATADFEIAAEALNRSDPRAMIEIDLAKSGLPKPLNAEGAPEVNARLEGRTIELSVDESAFETKAVFIEGPDDWYIPVPERSIASDGHVLFSASIEDGHDTESIRAASFSATLVTQDGAYEGKLSLPGVQD